ncbi:MAG TPA: amidohydrolase family protein, partial [Methanobacterium sp.]|nr:amidohydrolase family protein [Methanobacterium sp.]
DSPEQPQFSMEEFKVIIEEAQTRGIKTMAHAHGSQGIKNAVKAGIHSIEHGTYLDEEAMEMILERNVYLVPTLLAQKHNKIVAETGEMAEYRIDDAIRVFDIHRKNMEKAHKAGITMVMGTDCGVVDHGTNLQELELLCDIGMKPMEAVMSGTKVAAERLGWQDKIGTLEAGKLADIVISKADPLSNIKSLGNPDNIEVVIKDGKVIKNLLEP